MDGKRKRIGMRIVGKIKGKRKKLRMRKWERGGNGRDRGDRFIEKRMYVGGGRTKMVQRK